MNKSKSLNNLSLNRSFNRNVFLIKESDNNKYNNKKLLSLIKSKLLFEKILYLIKITQIDYLSNLPNNLVKKDIIKKIFNNWKNDLFSLLKSNIEKQNKLQIDINNKKCLLNNIIFGGSTQKVNKQEEKNKNKFTKELTNLKLLNFKIEYQIDYVDIMILLKLQNIKDIKSNKTELDDDYVEIFCDNKNDKNDVSELLHEDLIDIRKIFKLIVKKKYNQNKNLERLN